MRWMIFFIKNISDIFVDPTNLPIFRITLDFIRTSSGQPVLYDY
jgi:hypothetical protein